LTQEGFDRAPVLHCRDHESFLLAQGLATEEVVEKIPCGPANKEVYAPVDWGIEYRTYVDTSLWDPSSVDISGVIDTVAHIGYRVVHDDTRVCSGIQQYTTVYGGVQWVFGMIPLGRPPDRTSDISLSLVHPGSMSGWMSFMERNIPQRLIFDWDITRAGTKRRIPAGFLSDVTLSSWSYHWG
jgi:hypothetical protein